MFKSAQSTAMAIILAVLFSVYVPVTSAEVTEEKIEQITTRLESYSPDELLDRRDFLLAALDEEEFIDCAGVKNGTSTINELGICEISG